jgi:large subunit ribosomal protein L22
MSADETNKDDVTPEEIEAKASEEAAESQPAPKKKPAAKKPAAKKAAPKAKADKADKPEPDKTEEAVEAETVEAEAAAEAAESKPAAKKPAAKRPAAKQDAPKEEAKPARAASRRRGNGRRPVAEPAVLVRAQAKYVRTSARKARLVCDHIRGKDVAEARAILAFTPRQAAKAWSKLLESAVANAENNHELVGEELRIHSVVADEGPTLKRFRPRAMGRATRIRKRTSHLTITLTPKES